MHIIRRPACIIAVSLISILTTPVNVLAEQVLSRDDAVRLALQYNPRLTMTEQQQLAAQANVDVSRGDRLPQLDLSYQARRSDNPLDVFADKLNTRSVDPATDFSITELNDPASSSLSMTRLSLVWPVYTGGETVSRVRAAQARAEGAEHGHHHARAQIAHGTLSAYLQTQAAEKNVAQFDDAVDAAQHHVNTTRQLVNEGRIISSDQLTAEVFLSSMQTVREQAREKLRRARASLAEILGREDFNEMHTDAWSSENSQIELSSIEQIWQDTLIRRQDLSALRSDREAAQADLEAARAAYSPKLKLLANQDWYEGENSWSIAGVVSVNLYAGGRTSHSVDASKAQATMKEAAIRDKQLAIRRELSEAHARYTSAVERLRISGDHIEKARSSVDQITRRYGQGRTILIDVLQAERALVEIRSQALAAALDLELAVIDLKLANGSLMQAYADMESK